MTVPNNSDTYLPGTIQIPSSLTITAMTNSYPMTVTTSTNVKTEANTYIPGQLVILSVPVTYGMYQANGLTGKILATVSNQMFLDIDSRLFDAFSVPAAGSLQPAMLAPAGARNLQISNSTNQVPFQSLNNRGN